MNAQPHIFRRLTLELGLNMEQAEAFPMQNEIRRLVLETAAGPLDNFLSRAVPPGQVLRIPKLEIDLGTVSEREFKELFLEAFQGGVRKAWNEAASRPPLPEGEYSKGKLGSITFKKEPLQGHFGQAPVKEQWDRSDPGRGPAIRGPDGSDPDGAQAEGSPKKGHSGQSAGTGSPEKQHRGQVPPKGQLSGTGSDPLPAEREPEGKGEDWGRAESNRSNSAPGRPELFGSGQRSLELFFHFLATGSFPWWARGTEWQAWEESLLQQMEKGSSQNFCASTKEILAGQPGAAHRLLWQFSSEFIRLILRKMGFADDKAIATGKQLKSLILRQQEPEKGFADDETAAAGEQPKGLTLRKQDQFPPQERKAGREATPEQAISPEDWKLIVQGKESSLENGEAYYIHNAGLAVILSCLLPLFQRLDYLDEDRLFRSAKIQEKAIHLLHYLAFGAMEAAEPELVLNKIVCGWPLDKPIRRKKKWPAREKEEADIFLRTMIQHWGAVKNCSPDGLRHNFLMRDGKLSLLDGHWLLQVEKVSYDPWLLNRLPWTLSIVKYKWMKQRIHVEWV